jgi:alanine racemase
LSLGITPTLYTREGLEAFSAAALQAGREAVVHVKIDTGMHRYGLPPQELPDMLDAVESSGGLRVGGVWSHFAVAEDVLNPFTSAQFDLYLRTVAGLGPRAAGLIRHMANSAGIMTFPAAHLDMARAGIAIYGIHPSPDLADRVSLEPALSLKARVGMVKRLTAGEAISYGQRYRLGRDGTVATVPCGYADGLRRALTNAGPVLVGGRRRQIAGTVTMDHFLIDMGDDQVAPGDEVVLIGRQGSEQITAQEVASLLGTIPYEVVCGLSSLIPRTYVDRSAVHEAERPEPAAAQSGG